MLTDCEVLSVRLLICSDTRFGLEKYHFYLNEKSADGLTMYWNEVFQGIRNMATLHQWVGGKAQC